MCKLNIHISNLNWYKYYIVNEIKPRNSASVWIPGVMQIGDKARTEAIRGGAKLLRNLHSCCFWGIGFCPCFTAHFEHTQSVRNFKLTIQERERERKKREYLWEATGTIIGAWYQRRKLHLSLSLMDDEVIMLQAQIGNWKIPRYMYFLFLWWKLKSGSYALHY